MRFERSYGGVKTILEGEELESLLVLFQDYRYERVMKQMRTDDALFTLRAMAYKAYSKFNPDFEVNAESVNTQVSLDSRKAHLLFVVVLYLTVKFILPARKWETFFDSQPLEEASGDPAGGFREDFYRKMAKKITPQDIVRSAMAMEGGAEALFGDTLNDPSLN